MGHPELRVDESVLNWDAAEVTVPQVLTIAAGDDPMSLMISTIMPQIAAAVTEGVAATAAREQRFAGNVNGARAAYQDTDGTAQQHVQAAGELAGPASAGTGSASTQGARPAAGQAGQFGQMLSMAGQMAGQAAQIPAQIAGMAASAPQGVMQGVQGAMQQVGQMSGMGGMGGQDGEKNEEAERQGEAIVQQHDEGPSVKQEEPAAGADPGADAAAGGTAGERVPQPDQPAASSDTEAAAPPQSRPAESPPEIAL